MLTLAVVSMFINEDPIDSLAGVPAGRNFPCDVAYGCSVKNLAETDRDRFQDAEQSIEQRRSEVGIMNEVVGNAIDVPGNAHRIDEAEISMAQSGRTGKRRNIPKK